MKTAVVVTFLIEIVCLERALGLSPTDSSLFVVVQKGLIPTSGTTTLQDVTSKSAVNCGNLCLQFSKQSCNGFLFQKATCGSDTGVISGKIGTCRLLSFARMAAVSLGSSVNDCQTFYVRQLDSDVTVIQSGLTSTKPLASITVAAGYDCSASSNPCYFGGPEYFPYSQDTVHFVQCSVGLCYVFACTDGTNWNQAMLKCS